MAEPRQIEELAQKQIALFLAEEACQFLDCAIRLMAHSMPISAVIKRLSDEIDMLRESRAAVRGGSFLRQRPFGVYEPEPFALGHT